MNILSGFSCKERGPEKISGFLYVTNVSPPTSIDGRTFMMFQRQQHYNVHHIHAAFDDISLDCQVELFWKSESLGTTEHYRSLSVEDRHTNKIINDNGQYSMGLLWKKR